MRTGWHDDFPSAIRCARLVEMHGTIFAYFVVCFVFQFPVAIALALATKVTTSQNREGSLSLTPDFSQESFKAIRNLRCFAIRGKT